jgi:hypothetical protein
MHLETELRAIDLNKAVQSIAIDAVEASRADLRVRATILSYAAPVMAWYGGRPIDSHAIKSPENSGDKSPKSQ